MSEILSPCGSKEAFYAAIEAGCDAVYLAGKMFGARSFANNFTDEELVYAINYAHLYGVKVYVTCNILIYEREVLKLHPYLAPYKVNVLPLVKKYHSEKASEIYNELSKRRIIYDKN